MGTAPVIPLFGLCQACDSICLEVWLSGRILHSNNAENWFFEAGQDKKKILDGSLSTAAYLPKLASHRVS